MKSVLISGGSRGIGAATVRLLRERGWTAAFLYEKSEEAARALQAETGAKAIQCDMADRESVFRAFSEAERALGRVEALVSNAGIAQQKLFQDVTGEEWRRMVVFSVKECARLGLEFTMNLSDCGGSLKGPWLTGADAPFRA